MAWTTEVSAPDKSSINTLTKSCPTKLLLTKYGYPRNKADIDDDLCRPVTSKFWLSHMGVVDVGPFTVYGFVPFLQTLKRGFNDLHALYPGLVDSIGNEGCLCVRYVRGSSKYLSNHALGMAVDLTIEGVLDTRGDGKILKGYFPIYDILKHYYIYWGAGFPTEDGMHFEAGERLVNKWIQEKII